MVAYLVLFLITYALVSKSSIMVDFPSLFMVDQASNVKTPLKSHVFNMAIFNGLSLIVWACCFFTKWGSGYNDTRVSETILMCLCGLFMGSLLLRAF
jgi:hypothetical protein